MVLKFEQLEQPNRSKCITLLLQKLSMVSFQYLVLRPSFLLDVYERLMPTSSRTCARLCWELLIPWRIVAACHCHDDGYVLIHFKSSHKVGSIHTFYVGLAVTRTDLFHSSTCSCRVCGCIFMHSCVLQHNELVDSRFGYYVQIHVKSNPFHCYTLLVVCLEWPGLYCLRAKFWKMHPPSS